VADLVVVTGEENANQEVTVPVPGRASPIRFRFVVPSSGGAAVPLSTVTFADEGTTVPLADQNGAIVTPFADVVDAVLASPANGSVMLTPGLYGPVSIDKPLQFIGLAERPSSGTVTLDINVQTNLSAYFESCVVPFTADADAVLTFYNCQASGSFPAGGTLNARLSRLEDITGFIDGSGRPAINAFDCTEVTGIEANVATFVRCAFAGNITCDTTLTIKEASSFAPGITITATTIDIDAESLRLAVFAGVTFVGAVTGFGGGMLYWGKLTGVIVGVFVPPGSGRQNYTGASVTEANTQIFAPRRGVLCFLTALSSVNLKFTARVNGVDTTLTVTVNNNTQTDTTHFVEVQKGDLISLASQDGGTPGASGSALASAVFL